MANVQIRLDDDVRKLAQEVASNMGMDLAGAVRVFIYQMIRCNGLPFTPSADPFYSEKNVRHLEKVLADLNARRNVSQHDLIED